MSKKKSMDGPVTPDAISISPPTEGVYLSREEALAASLEEANREAAEQVAAAAVGHDRMHNARAARGNANGVRPRSVFFVLAQDEAGDYTELLCRQKTLRRAKTWIADNKAMIRRYCAKVAIFRAREVTT